MAWLLRTWWWFALAFVPLVCHAIEEPAFTVLQVLPAEDPIELREYAPYVVAEVVIPDGTGDAGREAFPILAGYIFGKNRGQQSFAMTAPVTQMAAPVTMAMTAPVTQAAAGGGAQRVQFVLPRGVSLAAAPEPLDPRVQLREVPASRLAVIRYSGTWSQANYDEHLAKLRTVLTQAGVQTRGGPVLARYNGPFTPWFLRRNEIWLGLR